MNGLSSASMAWRNLWRNRRRTILTLCSIAFGGLLAVMMTAMQDRSFSDLIDTAARLGGGHVTLQHPKYIKTPTLLNTVEDGDGLRQLAGRDPEVSHVVQRVTGQVMLSTARDSQGAFLVGIDPQAETTDTFDYWDSLVEGKPLERADEKSIVLGAKLVKKLDVKLGNKVIYTMMDKEGEIVAGMARLSGILRTGVPSLDAGLCLLPIDRVRELLGYGPSEATQVAVFISDSRKSDDVVGRLRAQIGPEVSALTWSEAQPQLASFIAMKVGGAVVFEILVTILVAAGIFNTMFVSVMERLREFGIMMAIGFSPGRLFRLVMWESVWLGLMGLLVGAVVTAWPYGYLASHGIDVSKMTGGQGTEVAGVGFDPILRVGIFPESLAVIMAALLVATMLAGLYPAWRAGRVVPVESIRLV